MNKKMKVILSVSILLNVLLLGIVIGGFSKIHADRGFKSHRMEQRLTEVLSVLPTAKSEEFKQRIGQLIEQRRANKSVVRNARKNIMRVFEQEPFDKKLYQQAVSNLNNLHQKQMADRVGLMTDMAEYLSPSERKQLARLIMKQGRRNNRVK